MKNNIFRTLLTLAFAALTLPMLSQDFMNIYFKNGEFRKFYMKNITEIAASKIDTEGIQHSDYCSQSITTIYDTYVYNLEDVDSITFTKIDEEKAEQNFVSAMTEVFPIISQSKTIGDAVCQIDKIKNADGVKDVWNDGYELYIELSEGEVLTFHFNHNDENEGGNKELANNHLNRVRSVLPYLIDVIKPEGRKLRAAIINQQHKDKSRTSFITDYLNPLLELFASCNIEAKYIDEPTVDFFYDNSDDPNTPTSIYDFDLILLNTHGNYMELRVYDLKRKDAKLHTLSTSEDLYLISGDKTSDELYWGDNYKYLKKWKNKKKYGDLTDLQLNFGFTDEIRDGKLYWVIHPDITEYFLRDIAKGKFINPHSILYNAACRSVMGDDDNPSFTLADEFFNKNLGVYIGYDEYAQTEIALESALAFYKSLLNGSSFEKAYYDENVTKTHHNAYDLQDGQGYRKWDTHLHFKINDYLANIDDVFLFPTYTEEIKPEEIEQEYTNNKTISLKGVTTLSDKSGSDILFGFRYAKNEDGEPSFVSANIIPSLIVPPYEMNYGKGNIRFGAELKNLELGKTYSYRAYTYDGLHYNYGETYEFKIDKPEEPTELTLSTTGPISLEVGESTTVEITSGNGDYTIENKAPSTISVKKNDNILTITALSAGPGTIIVTDNKTGQTKEITVEVKDSESSSGWVNLISNGDMEGTDASCFFQRTASSDPYPSSISDGVGKNNSRGIKVEATAKQSQHYDNQFWFRMTEPISVDTKYRFSFDYRADKNARINMEIHNEPAVYNYFTDWETECTPEWRTFTAEGIVSSNDSPSTKPFHSIAINLSWCSEANNYYFDNIKFEIYKEGEEPVADLALSSTSPISLKVGESKTITITSGSGNYSIKSSDDKVASVSRNGNTVTIKAVSAGPATITITDIKSGKTKSIEVEVKATSGVISYTACPDTHHPHWIDLGLPSGTKWSCCNEGASAPEEFGEYYEYGEVLTAPSQIQGEELIKNTTYSWGTLNGVNGGLFTGKNGGAIFLPATGSNENGNIQYVGEEGHYWPLASGSYVWTLGFNYDHPEMWSGIYYGGVRGIRRTVRSVSK